MKSQLEPKVEISGETLVDLLRAKAMRQPDRLGYSFLPKGEAEEARFTYAELDLRARAISAWLSSVSAAGDRVLLLSSSGPEFVSAVFGCLYRGAVAVPAYPLDPARISRTVSRLNRILKDAQAVVAHLIVVGRVRRADGAVGGAMENRARRRVARERRADRRPAGGGEGKFAPGDSASASCRHRGRAPLWLNQF